MRFLLITDTHGHLDIINQLAEKEQVDAAVHAGDFGFYDADSPDRLTTRELFLRVRHSDLPTDQKKRAQELDRPKLIDFVREHCPLSELPQYLSGEKRFEVPVYTVWGNHEDLEVVARFRDGRYQVDGLKLLDERQSYRLEKIRLFGLGGNVLIGRRLFHKPLGGGGGRVWSTLSQFVELYDTVQRQHEPGEIHVFVSHVSPGKERLVARFGAHLEADLLVSGHMDPPCCMAWSEFTVREPHESLAWIDEGLPALREAWALELEKRGSTESSGLLERGMELAQTLPDKTVPGARGQRVAAWYRQMTMDNLTDVDAGYAVLTEQDGALSLETRTIRSWRPR